MAERFLRRSGSGHCRVGMADYSTVPPPSSGSAGGGGGGGGGGGVNDAFKDALQRARQIAAKIGGDAGTSLNSNDYGYGGQKRPLEDGAFGTQLPPMHQQQRSVMTEEYKVPDGMVGFIIGRGGEQISRIQQESGCKIQIAPDSGGLPERSCMLTGTPESVQSAKRLLDQIVEKGRPAPGFHHGDGPGNAVQEIMIPASKAGLVIGKGGETIKQLQERAGVKMVMIQDGPQNTGADKPLRITGDPYKVQQAKEMVLELIRDQGGFREVRNEYGSRIGGNEGIDVPIPRFAVGIVIGRNGEMIKKIQNDAGVRIQFKPDDGTTPDRIAQITGPPDRCQHAAEIITDLLRSVQAGNPGGPGPGGRGRGRGQGNWNMGPPGGLQEFNFIVPTGKTGLIIGKGNRNYCALILGGETIKSISQQSGARIELQRNPPPNADPNMKLFTIRGTPQQIDYARQLIEEKIGGHLYPMGPMVSQAPMGLLGPLGLELQWDHITLHLIIQDHLALLLMVLQPLMLPRGGEMHIHIGSNRPLQIQLKQEQIQIQQLGLLIMLTIINNKHSHRLQLLPVHQLQPKPMDKEISRIQLQLDRLIIPRLGKSTTRKWVNKGRHKIIQRLGRNITRSKVKQFLPLLVLHQVVSQIIVQPGLSTTDNKQPTTPRQVPRECHSILQHLRDLQIMQEATTIYINQFFFLKGFTPDIDKLCFVLLQKATVIPL
ncbi:hypothetical protein E2I00_010710 [Balaenoptera physalus]|uniref:Far upstream element-binding protein 1 n=1 Tax=Balaenoptera physalus TaxID=9770 RepID=A0A6A1QC41_BALPH|nr:hypothetical protein E2I00_010710 [Balaenoptera physalus]